MAKYDLTAAVAPYLDRHLVFPLLEFLQDKQLYPDDQILKAKIELLGKTNMVDYAMDIHKSLYHTEDVPQGLVLLHVFIFLACVCGSLGLEEGFGIDVFLMVEQAEMVDRRVEVVGRLKILEESAAPLISFLQNPALVQELRTDKQYNLQMLHDRYQVY